MNKTIKQIFGKTSDKVVAPFVFKTSEKVYDGVIGLNFNNFIRK